MFEIFINNFIALAEMLIISVITVVTFIGTLQLCFVYIDFCFEHIKNYTISVDDVYISIAGTIGLVGIIPTVLVVCKA